MKSFLKKIPGVTIVFDSLKAAETMSEKGIECEVVNCRFIKPMDSAYLKSIIERFDNVVTCLLYTSPSPRDRG